MFSGAGLEKLGRPERLNRIGRENCREISRFLYGIFNVRIYGGSTKQDKITITKTILRVNEKLYRSSKASHLFLCLYIFFFLFLFFYFFLFVNPNNIVYRIFLVSSSFPGGPWLFLFPASKLQYSSLSVILSFRRLLCSRILRIKNILSVIIFVIYTSIVL